jgi:chromosome partitioning protein
MPVVAVVNSKGGVGKTTASLLLGTVLAEQGAAVSIIDADPNRHLVAWRTGSSKSPIKIIGDIEDGRLVSTIDTERRRRDLVVVDLEGTASRAVSHAISRADLVLVPLQPSAMDASQAWRAVTLIREEELVLDRRIAFRLLLTRTNPQIPTKAERMIVEDLAGAKIPSLKTHLHQRTAYQAMFAYKLALHELGASEVNGLPAAVANAQAFVAAVTEVINGLFAKAAA